jgi:hypothetical protein
MADGRIPHMATLIAAAKVICKVLDKYLAQMTPYLDTPELAAITALKLACDAFEDTLPINDV